MAEDVSAYLYPLDITGLAASNKVENERQTLNPPQEPLDFHFILPNAAPYFRNSMVIKHITSGRTLVRGVDWAPAHKFYDASEELQGVEGGVYTSILLFDRTLSGEIELSRYQTLGGTWTLSENKLLEILSNRAVDPRIITYEEVSGKPETFPPVDHSHDAADLTGMAELIVAVYDTASAIRERTESWLANPPMLVDQYYIKDEIDALLLSQRNASDESLASVTALMNAHIANYNNPHRTTKNAIGLGFVPNFPSANETEAREGVANNRGMTPQRVAQEIEEKAGPNVYDIRYALKGEGMDVTLQGPTSVTQGTNVTWTITNYDRFSTYSVSVNQGNVSINGDVISYTMPSNTSVESALELTVKRNDISRTVIITMLASGIATPVITAPLAGESLTDFTPTLEVAAFSVSPSGSDTHVSTDWVVARDPDFLDIVFQSLNDTTHLRSITIPALDTSATYYMRVRFHGNTYTDSGWATSSFSTTNQWVTSYNTSNETVWNTGYNVSTSRETAFLTNDIIVTNVSTQHNTDVSQTTNWSTQANVETFGSTEYTTTWNTEKTVDASWYTEYPESTPGAGDSTIMLTSVQTLELQPTSMTTTRQTSLGLTQAMVNTSVNTLVSQVTVYDTQRSTAGPSRTTSATTVFDTAVGVTTSRTTRVEESHSTSLSTSHATSGQIVTNYSTNWTTDYNATSSYNTLIESKTTSRTTETSVSESATTSHVTAENRTTNYTTSWSTNYSATTSYNTIASQATTSRSTEYVVTIRYEDGYTSYQTLVAITQVSTGRTTNYSTYRTTTVQAGEYNTSLGRYTTVPIAERITSVDTVIGTTSRTTQTVTDRNTYRTTSRPTGVAGYVTEFGQRTTSYVTNSVRTTSKTTTVPTQTSAQTGVVTAASKTTSYTTQWSSVSQATTSYITNSYRSTVADVVKQRTTSQITGKNTAGSFVTAYDTLWNTTTASDVTTSYVTNSDQVTSRTTTRTTENITYVP